MMSCLRTSYFRKTALVSNGYSGYFVVPTEFLIDLEINRDTYLTTAHFSVKEENIFFIEREDASFEMAWGKLFSSSHVGIDSEYQVAKTKLDSSSAQLLQMATEEEVFIFDLPRLSLSQSFVKNLFKLMT